MAFFLFSESGSGAHRLDADVLAVTTNRGENNATVGGGVEAVVAALLNILAGVNPRATLSNNDRSCFYSLSAKTFHTKSLCITIAAILRTANAFLMCHDTPSLLQSMLNLVRYRQPEFR